MSKSRKGFNVKRLFEHCGKELEHPNVNVWMRSVYKVTRCGYIATALSVPLKEFFHKFGALNWIHWNADVASLLRKGVRSWGT
jgi:hypothetical protein